jgi:hypothetical protein
LGFQQLTVGDEAMIELLNQHMGMLHREHEAE